MDIQTKITKARTQLLIRYPFYGSIVLRRDFIADPSCKTAWTDGVSIGYNPAWFTALSLEEIVGILAHEGSHIARKHHLRIAGRNPDKWNYAGDYNINPDLTSDGFSLPAGGLNDPSLKGKSTDQIYAMLPEGDGGDGNGKPYDEVRPWPGKQGQKPGKADIEAEGHKIDGEITQAANLAKKRGNLPAGVSRLIDEIKEATVDWRHLLRNYVQASAKDDYTWRRPNRRFIHQGIYLPSLYSDAIGELVVAVDTSGSTYSAQPQFIGEVYAIAKELKPSKLHLIYCDTAVDAHTYDCMDDLEDMEPKGGGGTSFEPVFQWVEEQGVSPVCLVYLTDMCGSFPSYPPNYPTIWVDCDGYDANPPFGDYVRMPIEA